MKLLKIESPINNSTSNDENNLMVKIFKDK